MSYTVVATDIDPRLEGCKTIETTEVPDYWRGLSVSSAYSEKGYWVSVYSDTGECVAEYDSE